MAGENLKIQNPVVPLITRTDEKFTSKTRNQKAFDIGKTELPVNRREDYSETDTQDFRPALTEENWLRERTLEELKTLVKAVQLGATDPWALTDMIFYARHPEMKGVPLTAEHQELLDEWNSISALLVHPTLNEIKDVIGADELNGLVNDKNDLSNAFAAASRFKINAGNLDDYTTRYDNVIASAVEWCPGLSPAVLKSLLAQESKFHPAVINEY